MKNLIRILLPCLFLFVLVHSAQAQFQMPAHVFGNGASQMNSGDLKIAGTLGQPVVTVMTGGGEKVHSGFWTTRTAAKVTDVETPEFGELLVMQLNQNYPNPFNEKTTIAFTIPKSTEVFLEVYDMLGRRVETLIEKTMPPGKYQVEFDAAQLPGGVYVYRLQTESRSITQAMNIIR